MEVIKELLHKCVEVYADNIFIYTMKGGLKAHLDVCCEVLRRLADANMSLKPKKCHVAAKSLNIVGYKVTRDGIQINPDKLQAIHAYNFPLSKTAVRRCLGMTNQYRKQIPNYASVVEPLIAMTRKDWPATWTASQVPEGARVAFENVKQALLNPPILAVPNPKEPFQLKVDASDSGSALSCLKYKMGKSA
jgi:hypothetical protein